MPIVGLDGVMGLPGYSGLVPNGMLANGMTLARDLLTTGAVMLDIAGVASKATVHVNSPRDVKSSTVERLQPNVRAALAEMELLQGVHVTSPAGTARRMARMSVTPAMKTTHFTLVSLPAPSTLEFSGRQLETVLSYADLRAERANEILSQVVPQTAYWSSIAGLAPEQHRYTLELLGIGLRFTMMVVMKFKLLLNCPRPHEYNHLVQPLILAPGYSSFPSGHASEAYFAAELLYALQAVARGQALSLPDKASLCSTGAGALLPASAYRPESSLRGQLHRLAFRIAENRVVAGLHFPADSVAGQLLGTVLAHYVVESCLSAKRLDGRAPGQAASERAMPANTSMLDANLAKALPTLDLTLDPEQMQWSGKEAFLSAAQVLPTLWDKAVREWAAD